MSWFVTHRKLLAPLVGSILMALVLWYRGAVADAHVGADEWVLMVTQLAMIVAVWGAANVPGWEKGKTVQAAILAVLALLASMITGGLTVDEIVQLIITGLSALGVALPSQPLSRPVAPPDAWDPDATLER